MKVTVIANISVNGRFLVSDNPHHQLPPEAMAFYTDMAKQIGNLVIGVKTFENFQKFPLEVKNLFKGIEIIILSDNPYVSEGYKSVGSPEEAIEYMAGKGIEQIAIGGGAGTFNAFIDQDLVTDAYLNINPLITGSGAIFGNNTALNTKFNLIYHKMKNGFIQLHLSKQ